MANIKSYYNILTLIIIIHFSCQSEFNSANGSGQFILSDSLSLNSLSTIPTTTICAKYYDPGNAEYLFWANRDRSRIEVFNMAQLSHEKSITIPTEGPWSIPFNGGVFSVADQDTIFLSSGQSPGRIYMIDTSGFLNKMIEFSDSTYYGMNKNAGIASRSSGDVYITNDGKLIIPLRTPGYKNKIPSQATVDSLNRFKVYDLSSNSIWISPIKFEYEIFKTPRVHKFGSNARLNSRIYYQNANSEAIYYTDDLVKEVRVDVSSEYHQDFTSYLKYPSPYMTWKYMFHYISLFSDPYRQLIYRVVKLPMANPELKDGVDE